ncbi:MAG: hemolysin D [Planctomycetota bacterium]
MSTESSLDPNLIEQTKQQIRSLVGEIARLTKSDVSPEEFYGQFLDRVVSALAAAGGAIWIVNEENRLALKYQINLQESKLAESEERQAQHAKLLYKVMADGEAVLVPPHSGTGDDEQAANPTEFLLVLGVFKTDLATVGLIEILQRPDAGPAIQRGYLRFLVQMCELAAEYLKSHQLKHFSHRQVLWTQLEDFCRTVHGGLDPRATAYTIANEGRRLIECDRLSVVICQGRRCRIEAISGQDVFDRRSNTVRLLEQLAKAVVATGEDMWYRGDTRDLAPQVEEAVERYVDESHSKTVAVLPLLPPAEEGRQGEEEKARRAAPFGALIVEQIEDRRVPEGMLQRVDVVKKHSALALGNAMEHHQLFLMPLWRALGKSRVVTQARYLPWTVSIGLGLLAVVLVLCLWPADFYLEAKGVLQPVERRNVFAAAEGVVDEILVEHDSAVQQGQKLVQLTDSELEIRRADIQGQAFAASERITSLERTLLEPGRSREDQLRTDGELAEERKRLQSLETQWALLEKRTAELAVLSPLTGQVTTWDPKKTLLNRPVQRGQVLLEVADPTGPWELELRVPERRMGHITRALKQRAKQLQEWQAERDGPPPPNVKFQLATDAGTDLYGYTTDVHLSAEVRGEEGNTVLIKVAIDKEKMPHLLVDTGVTGSIDCGTRPLGYVWLHDVWDFIQSKIVFRYF